MQEKILALALGITHAGAEEKNLLEMLCIAAENIWTGRLREGVTPQQCGEAFSCAAAFTAAADFTVSRHSNSVGSFRAGEISVTSTAGAETAQSAQALRHAAERLMQPYTVEAEFAFRGVAG